MREVKTSCKSVGGTVPRLGFDISSGWKGKEHVVNVSSLCCSSFPMHIRIALLEEMEILKEEGEEDTNRSSGYTSFKSLITPLRVLGRFCVSRWTAGVFERFNNIITGYEGSWMAYLGSRV